jgi:hypothetical protein
MLRLLQSFVALAAAAAVCCVGQPAIAASPSTVTATVDDTFIPPKLSAACGFQVTRHVVGTLTIRTFVDSSGNFVRELDQYRLAETLTANNRTLEGRTSQTIVVTVAADGSYTVSFAGIDFRLAVSGTGIAFGSAGRLLLAFAADDTFLGVVQDVGDVRGDQAAICAALTP